MDILTKLDDLHAAGELFGFTIWPTKDGFQANVALVPNAWRVRHGETPSEAVLALFEGGPLELLPEPAIVQAREVFEPEQPDEAGIFD